MAQNPNDRNGETKEVDGTVSKEVFGGLYSNQPSLNYRETAIGKSFVDTLNELFEESKIPEDLLNKGLALFDSSMEKRLSEGESKVNFSARKLAAYQLYENIWTFIVRGVEIQGSDYVIDLSNLRITAFQPNSIVVKKFAEKRLGDESGIRRSRKKLQKKHRSTPDGQDQFKGQNDNSEDTSSDDESE